MKTMNQYNYKHRWHKHPITILAFIFLICALPIILACHFYFFARPHGNTANYGKLIEPQRPIPENLFVIDEKSNRVALSSLKGQWLLISVDKGACAVECVQKLFFMRQIRALQSTEQSRLLNVWLITDKTAPPQNLKLAYPKIRFLNIDPKIVLPWLTTEDPAAMNETLYLVDPLGHLMMRFPKDPDPIKIKKDLTRLLKWSGTA